ncbi:hypothetical protein [Paludibaculum fermentans]|uniref:hypothetical protein n=1 Tax=Paludibaculum fermentans TaxID=1473598 RepID=UPI003EB9252C
MLFQPAILALLLASAANVVVICAIAPFAISILCHWDTSSGSERQLLLERRTYLVSTLLTCVLATQLLALLLFVFNADRMAPLFVAAMCAVGTLNVNEFGFPALFAQMTVFFLAALWLAIHHVDIQAPDYPLVRIKYLLLLGIAPALVAAFVLQLRYFLALKADVLTSCCSRLFSGSAKGVSADLTALPPQPAMIGFYIAMLTALAAAVYTAVRKRGGFALAIASLAAFFAALAAIVSFLSLYVYEHPHHHCPFCLLKAEYGYQGYLLYLPLFTATACGLAAGAVEAFAQVASLRKVAPLVSSRLARVAAAGFALFLVISTVIILRSHLILIENNGMPFSFLGNPPVNLITLQGVKP